MLRSALQTLRQPRYATLAALMLVVALVCVGAGTWQIARFEGKVHANDELRANAATATVPVERVLPLVGAPAPQADAVRFRTVTATGRYDASAESLVRNRSVGGQQGYVVLTPLRTTQGLLLVARGFVPAAADTGAVPAHIAAPPSGVVSIRGRVETGESTDDAAAGLPHREVRSINPSDQATRLAAPVFNGFLALSPHQPGSRGLTPLPAPDLSNPAGGAVEPQHFAYILQWYLFALLAVAAPFAMARADRRDQQRLTQREAERLHTHGVAAHPADDELVQDEATRRAVKLADRYGRVVH